MSIETPPTPTKEQLKRWAGAQNLQPQPTTVQPETRLEENHTKSSQNLLQPGELDLKQLRSVRPISARAIPKALFTALLLSPIFLVAFVFVNGIKLPSKDSAPVITEAEETQAAESEDATDEATRLRRQLSEANAQIALMEREEKQAREPLPQPAPKKIKTAARTKRVPARAVVRRTPVPVSRAQPLRPVPRAATAVRVKHQATTFAPKQKIATPKLSPKDEYLRELASIEPNEYLRQLASADVYGAATVGVTTVPEEFPQESGGNIASSTLVSARFDSGEKPSSTAPPGIKNAVYYPPDDAQETEVGKNLVKPGSPYTTQTVYDAPPATQRGLPGFTGLHASVASSREEGSLRSAELTQQTISPDSSLPQVQEHQDVILHPDSALEAPLLNGQPQHFLKGGTTANAVLAAPLALDGDGQQDVTIVLSEPLFAADRTEVFPTGTQIVASLRSLSEDGIAQVVGVFALLEKGNEVEKIALPDSAIQILTPEGEPLSAYNQLTHRPKQRRHRSLLGSVARRAVRSADLGSVLGSGSSSLAGGLVQEAADAAVSKLERGNDRRTTRSLAASVQYLAAGTEVGVFVTLPFSVPGSILDKTGHPLPTQAICGATPTTQRGCPVLSGDNVTPVAGEELQRVSSQPNPEPQLNFASDSSVGRSIAIFRLRNRLKGNYSEFH